MLTFVAGFEKNLASANTKSNSCFHQKWVAGAIMCALLKNQKSGSLSLTLCIPQVVKWYFDAISFLEWCLEGWVNHEEVTNVFHLQFGML